MLSLIYERVKITFDPAKRKATLRERGLDFVDAAVVFEGPVLTIEDMRSAYPERRYVSLGLLNDRMIVLAWTPMPDGRRIIWMRKANEREQKKFRERLR